MVTADSPGYFSVSCDEWFSGNCPDTLPGNKMITSTDNGAQTKINSFRKNTANLSLNQDEVTGTLYAMGFLNYLM
jgi:hypothetical protein